MNLKNKVFIGVVSATLISATTLWEGTRYKPYDDVVGVLTVCQGYAGKDVIRNKTYTPLECKVLLERELASHGAGVLKCVNVPLSPHEYDAYTLFAYNVGVSAFCKSKSVLAKLNSGDRVGACNGLLKFVYADGKYVQGLYNRRVYERQMCLGNLNAKNK